MNGDDIKRCAMNDEELMQWALDALLESKPIDINDPAAFYRSAHAIDALRARLAQPEQQHSEQWWRHEVSNAWAQGYENGRASVKQSEPVAWIKERELLYMQAVAAHGKTDWKTNLGLKPEDDDVPLYTAPWADAKLKEKNT